ncbi:MAG TPA: TonB-dependent receptor [Caulobacteraceae bacterium]|nr:TonB-dependent receptor [Caulobacteraceae bacterium]
MSKHAWMTTCAIGALGLGGGAAHAATATAEAASTSASAVSEITVTAQKREENIERVPVAVSAYTSKQRDLIGIESIQDMTNFTPGFSYSTSLDRAFIRGVGRQTNNLSSQPGVATYNDGVYNSSVVAAAGDSLFIDRTEILRGPQGTLYGRNSIGGTINAISRRPTSEFYAEGRASVGSYDTVNLEAAVSGPVAENVKFRVAAFDDNQNQGFYRNASGLADEGGRGSAYYVEGQLEASLGPVDLWGKLDTFGYSSSYRSGSNNAPFDTATFPIGTLGPGAGFVYNPCFTVSQITPCVGSPTGFGVGGSFTQVGSVTQNPGITDPRAFNTNTTEQANLTEDYNFSGQIVWHTPWNADLKYIGGYTQYHYHLTTDFDGTPVVSYTYPTVPGFGPGGSFTNPCSGQCPAAVIYPSAPFQYVEDKQYWSNEINLTSTGNAPFQWIVGFYQYHEQFTQPVDFYDPQQTQLLSPVSLAPLFVGLRVPVAPNPTADYYHANQQMAADSLAGFGQADWKVTDQVKLTGGVRYSWDWEGGVESTRQITWGLPAFFGFPAAGLGPIQIYGSTMPSVDVTSFLVCPTGTANSPAHPTACATGPLAPGVKSIGSVNVANGLWSRALSDHWSAVTGTAGAEWTPDDASLYYLKYSRGYKAGGFNTGTITTSPATQPEYIDAFEAGAKNQWFDRTLQTNIAVFYYDYANMQIPLSVQPATGPATTQFFNMKQVISYGVELETIWQPIANAQILFNYSYLNATIHDSSDCFVDGVDPFALLPGDQTAGCINGAQKVNGETVPESPRNRITLNGNYTFRFEPGSLTFSVTYIWKDRTYDSIFNRAYSLAPAYDQVDLRATWTDAQDRFTIIVFGKNVFNSLGYDNVGGIRLSNQAVGTYQAFGLTPPATAGVELQVRFR